MYEYEIKDMYLNSEKYFSVKVILDKKERNHPLTGYKDNDITLIQNYIIFEWEKLLRQFGNVANLNLLIGFWIAYGTILIFHNWFL